MTSRATGRGEIIINTTTTDYQVAPAISMIADGGWVVAWQSRGQDGDGDGIYMQRFAADGAAIGAEVRVNTTVALYQYSPVVAALADGGWVVAWQQYDDVVGDEDVCQQRFDAEGTAVGGESRVNTTTDNYQLNASIIALADGGWIVTWASLHDFPSGLYQQRFAADGTAIGVETRVGGSGATAPSGTALSDGGWVLTWTTFDENSSSYDVRQLRYASDGTVVSEEQRVNTYTDLSQSESRVVGLSDGGWLVVWHSLGQDGEDYGIYQQRYGADGSPEGAEQRVNTATLNTQLYPKVAALAHGGWVVVWSSPDNQGYGIYQQRYDAAGNAVGTETRVNITTDDGQTSPAVTALPGGGWIVTWEMPDTDGYGVYQRVFAADIEGTALADTLAGTAFDETIRAYGGNDTLNGEGGNDIMLGGFGNDTYIVDSTGDQVQEMAAQGTDTVRASISYTLGGSVENLTLTGSANLSGTGNSLANVLTGNSGNNTLLGLAGNDRLDGGAGNDTLDGGEGNDTLIGGEGNDSLDGCAGIDRMEGGTGNDTYYVDNSGDVVVEAADAGTDTVRSTISHTLATNVENLILSGSGNLNGNGNTLANALTGNTGNNILKGLAGNDTLKGEAGNDQLTGGAGADKLYGGAGADRFVFTALSDSTVAATGRDMIHDFSRSQGDKIDLSVIDASTATAANQAFTFIGEKTAFTGAAGELRYVNAGGDTYIYADVNGDKTSDFSIRVDADINLVAGDFIL